MSQIFGFSKSDNCAKIRPEEYIPNAVPFRPPTIPCRLLPQTSSSNGNDEPIYAGTDIFAELKDIKNFEQVRIIREHLAKVDPYAGATNFEAIQQFIKERDRRKVSLEGLMEVFAQVEIFLPNLPSKTVVHPSNPYGRSTQEGTKPAFAFQGSQFFKLTDLDDVGMILYHFTLQNVILSGSGAVNQVISPSINLILETNYALLRNIKQQQDFFQEKDYAVEAFLQHTYILSVQTELALKSKIEKFYQKMTQNPTLTDCFIQQWGRNGEASALFRDALEAARVKVEERDALNRATAQATSLMRDEFSQMRNKEPESTALQISSEDGDFIVLGRNKFSYLGAAGNGEVSIYNIPKSMQPIVGGQDQETNVKTLEELWIMKDLQSRNCSLVFTDMVYKEYQATMDDWMTTLKNNIGASTQQVRAQSLFQALAFILATINQQVLKNYAVKVIEMVNPSIKEQENLAMAQLDFQITSDITGEMLRDLNETFAELKSLGILKVVANNVCKGNAIRAAASLAQKQQFEQIQQVFTLEAFNPPRVQIPRPPMWKDVSRVFNALQDIQIKTMVITNIELEFKMELVDLFKDLRAQVNEFERQYEAYMKTPFNTKLAAIIPQNLKEFARSLTDRDLKGKQIALQRLQKEIAASTTKKISLTVQDVLSMQQGMRAYQLLCDQLKDLQMDEVHFVVALQDEAELTDVTNLKATNLLTGLEEMSQDAKQLTLSVRDLISALVEFIDESSSESNKGSLILNKLAMSKGLLELVAEDNICAEISLRKASDKTISLLEVFRAFAHTALLMRDTKSASVAIQRLAVLQVLRSHAPIQQSLVVDLKNSRQLKDRDFSQDLEKCDQRITKRMYDFHKLLKNTESEFKMNPLQSRTDLTVSVHDNITRMANMGLSMKKDHVLERYLRQAYASKGLYERYISDFSKIISVLPDGDKMIDQMIKEKIFPRKGQLQKALEMTIELGVEKKDDFYFQLIEDKLVELFSSPVTSYYQVAMSQDYKDDLKRIACPEGSAFTKMEDNIIRRGRNALAKNRGIVKIAGIPDDHYQEERKRSIKPQKKATKTILKEPKKEVKYRAAAEEAMNVSSGSHEVISDGEGESLITRPKTPIRNKLRPPTPRSQKGASRTRRFDSDSQRRNVGKSDSKARDSSGGASNGKVSSGKNSSKKGSDRKSYEKKSSKDSRKSSSKK